MTGLKQCKDVPAFRALVKKVSIQDISDMVGQSIKDEGKMARNAKIFLCHKYTGMKLRAIGETIGIGDSAVSKVFKRFGEKIEKDKQLKKKMRKLEKTIKMSRTDPVLTQDSGCVDFQEE